MYPANGLGNALPAADCPLAYLIMRAPRNGGVASCLALAWLTARGTDQCRAEYWFRCLVCGAALMKRSLFAVLATAFICMSGSVGTPAQTSNDDQNRWMIIKNEFNLNAVNIYITPSAKPGDRNVRYWSRGLLEGDPLSKGGSLPVSLDDGSGACTFDIRVVSDVRGSEWNLDNVTVCKRAKRDRLIVLRHTENLVRKSVDGEKRTVTIHNKSQLLAFSVFAIPSGGECCWSADLLAEAIIGQDKKLEVNFDEGTLRCDFDIHVVAARRSFGQNEWNFDRVNVCDRKDDLVLMDPLVERRRVRVTNTSQLTAFFVYAIPSGRNCCWSHDLLGTDLIAPDAFVDVNLDDGSGACRFDLKIMSGAPGKDWNLDGLNVCEVNDITLK